MLSMWDEAKKHQAFKETWVGYLLGGIYLVFGFCNHNLWISDIPQEWFFKIMTQNWVSIQ